MSGIELEGLVFDAGMQQAHGSLVPDEGARAMNAELQEEIDRRKRAIAKLVENQRRFKTDSDFVEKIARQNQRVFPGELVFIFEKD